MLSDSDISLLTNTTNALIRYAKRKQVHFKKKTVSMYQNDQLAPIQLSNGHKYRLKVFRIKQQTVIQLFDLTEPTEYKTLTWLPKQRTIDDHTAIATLFNHD